MKFILTLKAVGHDHRSFIKKNSNSNSNSKVEILEIREVYFRVIKVQNFFSFYDSLRDYRKSLFTIFKDPMYLRDINNLYNEVLLVKTNLLMYPLIYDYLASPFYKKEYDWTTLYLLCSNINQSKKAPPLNYLYIDIETDNSGNDILIVSTRFSAAGQETKVKTFFIKENYSEKNLLIDFYKYLEEINFDVIVGYNIYSFDLRILIKKSKLIYLETILYSKSEEVLYPVLDPLLYIREKYSLLSNTLQHVSYVFLDEKKISLSENRPEYLEKSLREIFLIDRNLVIEYCEKDVSLLEKLVDTLNIKNYYSELAVSLSLPLSYVMSNKLSNLFEFYFKKKIIFGKLFSEKRIQGNLTLSKNKVLGKVSNSGIFKYENLVLKESFYSSLKELPEEIREFFSNFLTEIRSDHLTYFLKKLYCGDFPLSLLNFEKRVRDNFFKENIDSIYEDLEWKYYLKVLPGKKLKDVYDAFFINNSKIITCKGKIIEIFGLKIYGLTEIRIIEDIFLTNLPTLICENLLIKSVLEKISEIKNSPKIESLLIKKILKTSYYEDHLFSKKAKGREAILCYHGYGEDLLPELLIYDKITFDISNLNKREYTRQIILIANKILNILDSNVINYEDY